ncbi:GNAT family N-acetyltransferase [Ornithinimicrobium faecis]|uniref:GNAT family N-acetyltransferase n=1 Tax=Ornithinimicrobium faecis TaxID=2934158 RepID=UPI003CE5096E
MGSIVLESAREQARAETRAQFPGGTLAEGHVILQATAGESLGHFWLGPHRDERGLAFIVDILITEAARGQGLGRRLLVAAEDWARDGGFTAMSLHVFGANTNAISMYESQGYETTDLLMRRVL